MPYSLALLPVLCGTALWHVYARERARVMAERRRLFIDCAGCVQDAVTRYDALGYTVVRGRHCGLDVRFSAVVDNISVRKLPQLLMLVTLRGTIALPGIVDALATPQNTEFYSPWSRLPHQVNAPGWPAHVAIRTGAPADRAMLAAIHKHRSMFDDSRVKELLISPSGVRLIYRLQEGRRDVYLLLRQAAFGAVQVDVPLAQRLLDAGVRVYHDVASARQA
jgi:hypothetical protein